MTPLVSFLRHAFPPLWLAGFFYMAFHGTTVHDANNRAFLALIAPGALFVLTLGRDAALELWRRNKALLTAAALLAAAIAMSEIAGRVRGLAPPHSFPPQIALLLCMPVLAVLLEDKRWLTASVAVFGAFCAWHIVAMPVEAVTGAKLSWHAVQLLPRDSGPFHYQASGLAWQAYYFPGLFLPLFYLAWGPIYEKRVFANLEVPRRVMLALALLWVVAAASVQSRSAFAGALCAALLAIVATSRSKGVRVWFAAALLAGFAGLIYWQMFAENKSGAGLRVTYFSFYVEKALEWPWPLTGRSFYLDPDLKMMPPGVQMLQHSHNDIAQILFSWGVPGLAAYLAFWVALLRTVWKRFVVHREVWPACFLVVLFPSMVTDLGFQHFEKAAAVVLLAAMCMALREQAQGRSAGKVTP